MLSICFLQLVICIIEKQAAAKERPGFRFIVFFHVVPDYLRDIVKDFHKLSVLCLLFSVCFCDHSLKVLAVSHYLKYHTEDIPAGSQSMLSSTKCIPSLNKSDLLI